MPLLLLSALLVSVLGGDCGQTCCQELPKREPMTFYYYQNTGRFFGGSGTSKILTYGYSGSGQYKNQPSAQCMKNKGPAPANIYMVTLCKNTMHDPPVDRPCSFWIEGQDEARMCGRSEIFIHGCKCCTAGDHTEPPVDGCSAGCIIINEENRKKLRVGDTVIVENYDPLVNIMYRSPLDELYVIE